MLGEGELNPERKEFLGSIFEGLGAVFITRGQPIPAAFSVLVAHYPRERR